jgi:MFS superfamily sulfate permease-like transporter
MGVLSALPLINVGNACCCLWVIGGGMVAAYVLQQNQATPIAPGDGALVGLLAGLVGAVVQAIISIPIDLIVGPMERAMVQRFMEMAGNMPPDMRDMFERVSREGANPAWFVLRRIFGLVFWLFIGAIFSTLGGLIGAAVFKKTTPPGTIDVTPTSS